MMIIVRVVSYNNKFNKLKFDQQEVYFAWMDTLIEDGMIDPDIDQHQYIDKMHRMHKADTNQSPEIWPFFDKTKKSG